MAGRRDSGRKPLNEFIGCLENHLALGVAGDHVRAAFDPHQALVGAAQPGVDQLGVAFLGGDGFILLRIDQQGWRFDCRQRGA